MSISSHHDIALARAAGVDGVVVSNHGGRQLDGSPATLGLLPSVVEASGPDMPVLIDGGMRRGSDVVKAIALGARAVLLVVPRSMALPRVERQVQHAQSRSSRMK